MSKTLKCVKWHQLPRNWFLKRANGFFPNEISFNHRVDSTISFLALSTFQALC